MMLAKRAASSRPFTPAAAAGARVQAAGKAAPPCRRSVAAQAACWKSRLVSGLAGVGLGLVLATGTPLPAMAATVIEEAVESELSLESQSQQLEYILQQQALAKRAQIEAQRQQLLLQRSSVETALQQKITEQRANALSAKAKGDNTRFQEIEAEAAQLEETRERVKAAAAKVEAQISRAEMLEKARTVAGQQTIRKAVSDAEYGINLAVDAQLESKLASK